MKTSDIIGFIAQDCDADDNSVKAGDLIIGKIEFINPETNIILLYNGSQGHFYISAKEAMAVSDEKAFLWKLENA